MALATLSVDFVAKVAAFEADLKRVARTSEQNSERMAAAFGLAKSALGGLVAGLSVGASVAFFRNIVDGIDALNDLADATGSSIENLSGLEDVAARTGTSMETVGSAVIKLNKTLADAKPGSDAAAALAALGLSAKELKALDPAEALRLTAVALAGFADDGNKARLTQELFGKSLREVAPLLKDLAESGRLNATVTTEQAEAAEAFNIELFKLQKNAVDVARDLAGPMVDAINRTIEAFRQGSRDGKGFFETLRAEQLKLLGFGNVAKEVENLRAQLAIEPKGTGLYASLEKQLADKTKLLETSQKAAAAVFRPSQNYGDAFKPSAPVIGGGAAGGGQKAKKVDPIIDPATADAIRALEGTDLAKIAKLNAQLTELFTLQRETKGAPGVAEAIAKTREELAKLDPVAVAAAESAKRLQGILDQTPTAKFAEALVDIQLLNKAFDDGKISATQWAEAIRGSTAKIGADGAAEEIEKLSTFAEQAGRNIQDALGDSLESLLAGNFKSIGDLWADTLRKMVAQAAAAQLNSYLFGDTFGQKGGSLGGAVGDLFKFISSFGGARADGGPVSAGRAYLVGERGPELMVPGASGTVVPNRAIGGPQITYAPVFNFTDATAEQIGRIRAVARAEYTRFARQMSIQGAV